MKSKYQLKNDSFYYPNTDIPKNKFDIKDSQNIDCAIECVQYADESGFEKIILNGLKKI